MIVTTFEAHLGAADTALHKLDLLVFSDHVALAIRFTAVSKELVLHLGFAISPLLELG